MSSDDSGFLSRWSRRKAMVRSGQDLPPEPEPPAPVSLASTPIPAEPGAVVSDVPETLVSEAAEPPVPTLDDVADLTPQSDFKPFVARHVPSEVRNAAVKKLFADPHFNVMDGLDIYIDDYTKTEPIPATMLAKMASAQFLKLVDDPNATPTTAAAQVPAAPATGSQRPAEDVHREPEPVPQSESATPVATIEETHDDHPDLQLQPDHAPGPQGPGAGAG